MPAKITNLAFKGSQLILRLKCQGGPKTEWKSQPNCNHYLIGNITRAASVLFSANKYQRLARFFDLPRDVSRPIHSTAMGAQKNCPNFSPSLNK